MKLPNISESGESRWFEQDAFWEAVAPILFSPDRFAAARDEVPVIVEMLGLAPGARILDVFCGPGRYAVPFQEAGFSVVGVDRTYGYLRAARHTLGAAGRLFLGDFGSSSGGTPAFQEVPGEGEPSLEPEDSVVAGPFDAAIWLGSSTGYDGFAGDKAVLHWIRDRLGPGRPLLIEVTTLEDVGILPATTWEWFEEGSPEIAAVWRLEHTVATDPATSESWLGGSWRRWELGAVRELAFRHRVYSQGDWASLLHETGYSNILWHNNLDRSERAESWVTAFPSA